MICRKISISRQSIFARFFILGFGISLALLLGEALVRIFGVAPRVVSVEIGRYRLAANPKIGYEPIPGLDYKGQELWNYDWRGEVNRLGYRSSDYPPAKKPGEFRILVFGDSIAAGIWIDKYSDTFPSVLEQSLRKSEVDAQILNFGVVGYNTLQEVETLKEKGLAFHPDAVLIAYCLNDRVRVDAFLLNRLLAKQKSESGVSAVGIDAWLIRSAFWRTLRQQVFPQLGARLTSREIENRYHLLNQDTVEESLRELGRLSRQNDFRVILAVFPYFKDLQNYRYESEHRQLSEVAREQGFLFEDLLGDFRDCSKSEQRLNFDEYHPNVSGHRCAGQAMARFILSHTPQISDRQDR